MRVSERLERVDVQAVRVGRHRLDLGAGRPDRPDHRHERRVLAGNNVAGPQDRAHCEREALRGAARDHDVLGVLVLAPGSRERGDLLGELRGSPDVRVLKGALRLGRHHPFGGGAHLLDRKDPLGRVAHRKRDQALGLDVGVHLGENAVAVGLLELGQDVSLPRDRVLDAGGSRDRGGRGTDEGARPDLGAHQPALSELAIRAGRRQVVDARELGEAGGSAAASPPAQARLP